MRVKIGGGKKTLKNLALRKVCRIFAFAKPSGSRARARGLGDEPMDSILCSKHESSILQQGATTVAKVRRRGSIAPPRFRAPYRMAFVMAGRGHGAVSFEPHGWERPFPEVGERSANAQQGRCIARWAREFELMNY